MPEAGRSAGWALTPDRASRASRGVGHWPVMKARSVVVLLAALAVVLTGCAGHDAVDQSAGGQFRFVSATTLGTTWKPADRKKAGNLTAQRLNGPGTLSLRQYAGKIVVVNYWASWCPPCQIETPQFDTLYRRYKSQGVVFLGVDFKEHNR
jgi:thiol-disulfide isomerase/thioredoxin